jgi:hypothetical protein
MARNSGAFFISIHCVTYRSISIQSSGGGESFPTFRDFEELLFISGNIATLLYISRHFATEAGLEGGSFPIFLVISRRAFRVKAIRGGKLSVASCPSSKRQENFDLT